MLLYMVAFLDRVNISFAALTMNRDLGISESVYGFAAGIFFLSYCLFEVPANLVLARLGARRWLAISWSSGESSRWPPRSSQQGNIRRRSFFAWNCGVRLLPGRDLLSYLLAAAHAPHANPCHLSSRCSSVQFDWFAHLRTHSPAEQFAGLRGWQWLFLMEGAPAVILGVAAWFLLADGPWSAAWLSREERQELTTHLNQDEKPVSEETARQGPNIARDCVIYFLWSSGNYGLTFWLPKVLVVAGASNLSTGWWATATFGFGALAMLWASRRRGFRALPFLFLAATMGFVGAALAHSVLAAVASFSLAAIGLLAALPIFWSLASSRLTGKVAGAAIALVNSVGAVGAFAGPFAMGWLHDVTHHYSAGLWAIAGGMALGGWLVYSESAKRPSVVPQAAD